MSEAKPITMAMAPLQWMTNNHALTYNIYFLLSLTLNGWVTWLVLRRQGIGVAVALASGIAMLLLPAVHWQAGVLQLVPVWAIVWSLCGLRRILVPDIPPTVKAEAKDFSSTETGGTQSSPVPSDFVVGELLEGRCRPCSRSNGRVLDVCPPWCLSCCSMFFVGTSVFRQQFFAADFTKFVRGGGSVGGYSWTNCLETSSSK